MAAVSYSHLVRSNRNFRLYWFGQIVSQLGDWFSAITVQALLLKYTGNAGSLAGFMIATMLPGFLLGPVAGVIVDRLPRKTVMIAADLFRAAIALSLLSFRGPETVWLAYAAIAGLQIFATFFEPARIATLPNITLDEELITANALSSVTWSILLTSGALAGGLVGHFLGPQWSFILNAVSFIASAVLISRIAVPPTDRGTERTSGFGEMVGGFRYVREHPEVLGALTAKLGWGLAGGVQVLLPIFGAKIFPLRGDSSGQLSISLLFAAGGIGTALGPILARRFTGGDPARIRWAIAVSFLLGGIYYACMAGAPNLGLVAVFLLLARTHGAVVWVFSTVLLQFLTRDRFRGRVFAAETSLFTGSMMLSSVLTARALDLRWASVSQVTLVLALLSAASGIAWVLRLSRGGFSPVVPATASGGDEPVTDP